MIRVINLLSILNIICVVVVVFFANRMLKASSKYNWNPGDSDVQDPERIKILQSIVAIACIGLIAAIVNILLG